MALDPEVSKALGYLRRKYKVSERDLVGLAKKFKTHEEPEENWEEFTMRILRNRQGQFARRRRYHK